MKLDNKQLSAPPKEIGELDGDAVLEVTTKGGLCLVMVSKNGGQFETLGTGSHRAIARHIAQKENPRLKINELSKGEQLPLEVLLLNLVEFIELTHRIQEME